MDHERPIEKLLRRYAKKRRDEAGAPLELHPATRRLWQDEVSRQFPKAGRERNNSFAGWFTALRRRWVYATAAGAVVIAGVLLVLNRTTPPTVDLAKNAPTFAKSPARKLAPGDSESAVASQSDFAAPVAAQGVIAEAPAPALTPPTERHEASGPNRDLSDALTLDADAKRARALSDESVTIPLPSAPASPPALALAKKSLEQKAATSGAKLEELASAARADKLASTQPGVAGENRPAPPPAAAVPATSAARRFASFAGGAGFEREKLADSSQSFANVAPLPRQENALKAAPVSPVLLNFQVEQTGNRVAVIDSDGSTYLGELSAVPVSFSAGKDVQEFKNDGKPAGRLNAEALGFSQQSTQNYLFRVAGTNRTLNQQVVFTWNFVELTNALVQSKAKSVSGALNIENAGVRQQFPTLLRNSAINGRAQINAAGEIEINAVPVAP